MLLHNTAAPDARCNKADKRPRKNHKYMGYTMQYLPNVNGWGVFKKDSFGKLLIIGSYKTLADCKAAIETRYFNWEELECAK